MTRNELIERVARRAHVRYGQKLPESLFDDLVENGLIPKGERLGNEGKSPVYEFGSRSFRRALQIVRFRSKGITRRDSLRVHLFIRRYSQPVWDVREALSAEYLRFAKTLLHQVRSGYADNQKSIGPKHKASIVSAMGNLDPRFEAIGLKLSADLYIEGLRTAKQCPIDIGEFQTTIEKIRSASGNIDFQTVASESLKLFSGLLMLEDNSDQERPNGGIESIIRNADDGTYLVARDLCRALIRQNIEVAFQTFGAPASDGDIEAASAASVRSVIERPDWSALALVLGLIFASKPANSSTPRFP